MSHLQHADVQSRTRIAQAARTITHARESMLWQLGYRQGLRQGFAMGCAGMGALVMVSVWLMGVLS